MKIFKLFLLLFVAAGSIFNFTACKDKDDELNISPEIIGTWVSSAELETIAYTFETNGKFVETYTYQGQSENDYGTYTYDGKILTLKYDDGTVESYPIVISGNTLTMNEDVYTKQ